MKRREGDDAGEEEEEEEEAFHVAMMADEEASVSPEMGFDWLELMCTACEH